MSRLFHFLLKLAADQFYGEVHIRFQGGKVHGQIRVEQAHLESTLPEADPNDPAFQQALAQAAQGGPVVAAMLRPLDKRARAAHS